VSVQNPSAAPYALRRIEDRLKAALTAGRMATWEWDPETDALTASESIEVLFGLPLLERTTGDMAFSLVHPEDRENHRALVMAAVRNAGSWHDEYRVVRPRDGKVVWLEERAHAVRNPRTGRMCMVGVIWDISERKLADEALRESQARHALLLELDDALRPLADPDEILRVACDLVRRRLGNEAEELVRAGRDSASPPRGMRGARAPGEAQHRIQLDVADRAWLALERARADQAVRRSEEKYRALFTSIDQGFCIQQVLLDDRGNAVDLRFLEVNRAFEQITGLRDVVGQSARELRLDTQALWLRTQSEVAVTGEPVRFETYVAAWDRWFDIYSVRIGEAVERKVASVLTDITDRRRAESRLREAAEFDAFRVALNDTLRPLGEPTAIQSAAAHLLRKRLGVARAEYAEVATEGGADYLHVKAGYPEPAHAPAIRLADVGGTLVDELRAGRMVVVPSVERERRFTQAERAEYIARGVRAYVDLPLIRDGRLVATLSVQHDLPRTWTPADVARIEEAAQRTWAAVDRARAEAALRLAHEELEARVRERTRELAETNASLREQIAERRRAEHARQELLRELVNAEEAERRRISRELHDELGQQVSALNLKLSMLRRDPALPPSLRAQLEALEKIARQADNDLDFLVWQLRPMVLDDLGLAAALRDHVDSWSGHYGIECVLHAPAEEMRLDPEIETVLYRVAQEALNNVAKHARASRVDVRLERGASHASLTVSDDGIGFESREPGEHPRGLGLVGMRERASFIGGEMSVVSKPGSGTVLKVDVPLPSAT
jgi:PAS domain S-box-containing protein